MTTNDLAPLGTSLLLDNDRVRVWELVIEPGGDSGLHHHDHDYLLVILEGDRIAAESEKARIDAKVSPPLAVFMSAGETETAINTGQTRYREIIVELKN